MLAAHFSHLLPPLPITFPLLLPQTLQAGVERVRARIAEPYQRLERHTLMLARLQAACELLRRMIRCLAVTSRLRAQLDNCPRDLAKAATSVSELGQCNKIILCCISHCLVFTVVNVLKLFVC